MDHPNQEQEPRPSLREIYPSLTDEQLMEAEDNLDRYLELALRIYGRILADSEAYAQFQISTAAKRDATIRRKVERPNPSRY